MRFSRFAPVVELERRGLSQASSAPVRQLRHSLIGSAHWSGADDRSIPASKADALHTLAERVARLTPCHRDPHSFHEAKSEIADEVRR